MQTINSPQTDDSYFYDKPFFKGFTKLLPIITTILSVIILIGGYALWYRDSNVSNVQQLEQLKITVNNNKAEREQQIKEIKEQLEAIKQNSVSRELFDSKIEMLNKQSEYQNRLLERIDKKVQ